MGDEKGRRERGREGRHTHLDLLLEKEDIPK
jgi:hypothetical protein